MEKWVDITGISIPSDENNYDELIVFADAIAELDPIDMETIKTEAYNRGIDSERKRIVDSWCKAEYERGYKDGQESAERKGEWIWSPRDTDGTVSGCCSNCSFSHLFTGGHTAQYNYCPNCGARMKGAEDE